jgi:hypothetical protein
MLASAFNISTGLLCQPSRIVTLSYSISIKRLGKHASLTFNTSEFLSFLPYSLRSRSASHDRPLDGQHLIDPALFVVAHLPNAPFSFAIASKSSHKYSSKSPTWEKEGNFPFVTPMDVNTPNAIFAK